MAKQRIQTRYAKDQVRLNPQARPVNTYVQPSQNNQLSNALNALVGNVQRKQTKDQQALDQANATAFQIQKLQAAEAAYANGELGSWDAVKKGLSLADDPKYGPLLQIAFNQKVGTETGLAIQAQLRNWDAENSHLRDSDPVAYNEALDAETKKLLTEKMGPETINAVGYTSHLQTQVETITGQLKSQQAAEYRAAQAALPLDNFMTQLGAAVHNAELLSENDPENRMTLLGEAVRTSLETAIKTKTLPPKELNSATTDYLITLATEKKDLNILNIAKTISTGHGGYLWGIHSEKKKLLQAQRTLAAALDNDEYTAYQKKQRAISEAKTTYQEAAHQFYLENGTFDGFEETPDVLGDYEVATIQKRVQQFQETPILTQEDYDKYYTIFSSVTELTADRAREMLERMNISSQGEWQLAEAAMSDVLNKRNSVFNGQPYKQAADFINHTYKIDPQSKISLQKINEAQYLEYQRTVQELTATATSYIVDQSALDKGLKDIGADEAYLGKSLHLLPASVKYDLFMHIAKKAQDKYGTSLGAKASASTGGALGNGQSANVHGITVTATQTGGI